MAKGIHQKPEFKEMLTSVSKLHEQLNEMKQRKQSNRKQLQQSSAEILSDIKNLRLKINTILDSIEQNTRQQLDMMIAETETMLKRDIEACKAVSEELKKIHDGLQSKRMSSELLAFRTYKTCEKKSKEAKDFLQSAQDVQDITIKFTPHIDIGKTLSSLNTFGMITSNTALTVNSTTSENKATDDVHSLYRKPHVYSTENIKAYDVRIGSDTETCFITGICVLPDGNYVMADWANLTVKLLNDKYSIIDEYDLIGRPNCVCHIIDGEVAVTTKQSDSKINFLGTKHGKLTATRSVRLYHNCRGIAYHGNKMYIGSSDGLYIHDALGKQIRLLYGDPVGYVAVGDEGTRIYVTQNLPNRDGLVTLNQTGNMLTGFCRSTLNVARGVTVTENGNVFVCGQSSETIIQVDKKGMKQLSTLAAKQDGVVKPQALCFNRKTSELIVGQKSNNILVIKLK